MSLSTSTGRSASPKPGRKTPTPLPLLARSFRWNWRRKRRSSLKFAVDFAAGLIECDTGRSCQETASILVGREFSGPVRTWPSGPRSSGSWEASTKHWTPALQFRAVAIWTSFYRIIRAGHTLVYEPRFLVFHQHRRDMKSLLRPVPAQLGARLHVLHLQVS